MFHWNVVILLSNKSIMNMQYTKRELKSLETIEQAWDGDELKIQTNEMRVWLVLPENRQYNGDYVIEFFDAISGRWDVESFYFNN